MRPGRPIESEAALGCGARAKKSSPRSHGQGNRELILQIGGVLSRAWPVRARCRGKCCHFYYFVPLNALIGPVSSAALCPRLDSSLSSDSSLHMCAHHTHTHAHTRYI